jgi:AmpE protein
MATVLFAVLIALVVGHTVPDLGRLRRYGWLNEWQRIANGWFGAQEFWRGGAGAVVTAGLPVLALALLQWLFAERAFGIASLVLGVVVLFYCWGPRDLDLDVDAIASAPDAARRVAAMQQLNPEAQTPPPTFTGANLVDHVFRAALSRWFGVLFWFVLLGPAGALLYRLTQLIARQRAFSADLPAGQTQVLEGFAQVLDWPAAQLMTLGLAVAADFDAVATAWRDFHAARNVSLTLDLGFLLAAARASVEADVDGGDAYDDARAPLIDMHDAMALIWRILIVWGVVFALFVLAGKIS